VGTVTRLLLVSLNRHVPKCQHIIISDNAVIGGNLADTIDHVQNLPFLPLVRFRLVLFGLNVNKIYNPETNF